MLLWEINLIDFCKLNDPQVNKQKQPPEVFYKKVFLEILQNSHESACVRVSFLIKLQVCNFIKKETLSQVFSCEFFVWGYPTLLIS